MRNPSYIEINEIFEENAERATKQTCCKGCWDAVKHVFDAPPGSAAYIILQNMVLGVVFLSTTCVLAETVPEWEHAYKPAFDALERFATLFFTLDFMIRMCIAGDPCCYHVVDFLAIFPWYLDLALRHFFNVTDTLYFEEEANAFQLLRLIRVLRLLKAARHSEMVRTIAGGLWQVSDGLFALLAFISMGAVFAATAVFFLERKDPETDFVSIPRAMWWAFPTITGVGYGDMVPRTPAGQVAGIIAMVAGVLVTALAGTMMTSSVIEKNIEKNRGLRRGNSNMCLGVADSRLEYSIDIAEIGRSISSLGSKRNQELDKIEERLKQIMLQLQHEYELSQPEDSKSQQQLQFLISQSELWFRQVRSFADAVKPYSTRTVG